MYLYLLVSYCLGFFVTFGFIAGLKQTVSFEVAVVFAFAWPIFWLSYIPYEIGKKFSKD